jgi:gliotoxin biosynthesis N-methyltransferase
VGIDIDASKFPPNAPSGITYQIQDINKQWPEVWLNSFDVVHQRLALVGAGPNAQAALKNISELVKPGGWIQLIEADNVLTDANGPAMHDFVQLMKDVFTTIGTTLNLSRELSGWVKEDGFLHVQERVFNVLLGATNPNPQLAKRGVYSTLVAATGLATFGKSKPISCIFLANNDQLALLTSCSSSTYNTIYFGRETQ